MKKANEKASVGYESPSLQTKSLELTGLLCLSGLFGVTEDVMLCDDADYWFQGTEDLSDGFSDWF